MEWKEEEEEEEEEVDDDYDDNDDDDDYDDDDESKLSQGFKQPHSWAHRPGGQYLPFPSPWGGQEFYTRNRYIAKIMLSKILWGQIHVGFFIWGALPPCAPCAPLQLCAWF